MELPMICVVTADEVFHDDLVPEMLPWFQVAVRETYRDLARWTKQAKVVAVLVDIDTDGPDAHGGLTVIDEMRRLNENFVLISLSRSRTRSLEKLALQAGADAHFRSPVDISELRLTLVDSLRIRQENAVRKSLQQQAEESSRFQDFVGASEPMRRVYDAIQQVADSSINVLIRGESGTGKELVARALVALANALQNPTSG
jgi:DNA-binding NtrC family response regulator